VAQLNNRGITTYRSNDNTQASAIVLTIYTTSRLVCWQFFGKKHRMQRFFCPDFRIKSDYM